MEKRPSGLECTGCGLFFAGMGAFDRHRTGTYQPLTRRCMNATEMLASGLVLQDDVWRIPLDERAREQLARLRLSVGV
jgi:hypothetical protein